MPNALKFKGVLINERKVKRVLEELPQKIRGRIMRDATKKAAKPIVKYMKSQVPSADGSPKTRTLKKAISSKVKTYRKGKNAGLTYVAIGHRTGEAFREGQIPWKGAVPFITVGTPFEYGWNMTPDRYRHRTQNFARSKFPKSLANEIRPAMLKEGQRIAKKHKANKLLSSSELESFSFARRASQGRI
jgi:ribosomal protein S7